MREYPVSDRVRLFRERARNSVTEHKIIYWQYGWDYRQLLLFYEGWLRNADAESTLLRRCRAEVYMLDNLPVCIDPADEFLGMPDIPGLNAEEWARFEELRRWYQDLVHPVVGRLDHMSPNYDKLLAVGVDGLLQEIAGRRSALPEVPVEEWVEKNEYYDMCEAQLNAVKRLASRYVAKARAMGMEDAAARLERVPAGKAKSFHDALQSIHFYSFLLRGLYSFGHPDRTLIRYYREDMAAGVLTEERALELLDQFNLLYTFYTRPAASISYMIGGRWPDGSVVENELTWLLLQSIRHTNMPYPGVGLAVCQNTGKDLLRYAMENCALGYTHPAFFNDELIVQGLMQTGKPFVHACEYVHSSCVEITVSGRSGTWVTSPYHNCAEILLCILEEKQDFADLEALLQAYLREIAQRVQAGLRRENRWQLERRRNGGESILVSCLMEDCLARGKSIDQGGALYNDIMPDFVGVTTAIDSLAAIQTLVFQEKTYTLAKFMRIVRGNFQNQEPLRQYIVHRCPHFGNDDALTNDLARRVYEGIAEACRGLRTFHGGQVMPGAFSFLMHEEFGRDMPATPDGRKAGEALNAGADPVSGRDTNGPTATVLSMTSWNALGFLGGVANNLRLDMNKITPERLENLCALLRTYLERGGVEVQINAASADVLQDAIEHPEAHRDLIVRIGGYSDFFVTQNRAMQREILRRTQHGL